MTDMTRYAYCDVCKKQVENTTRKPLETFAKVIWVIIIVATIGIAALIYAIYYLNRPKNYCATCLSKVKFSSEPFKTEKEKEGELIPLTPKEKILKKAGQEVERKEKSKEEKERETKPEVKPEETFCPYCGEDIKPGTVKCPYCHTTLTTP